MKSRVAITPLVTQILRGRIVSGAYAGKLPGERALAEEFKTNPRTAQNALMRLEAAGLVTRRARSGTYVVPPGERAAKGALLHVRLLVRAPYVGASDGGNWAWLLTYGFHMAAEAREVSVVTEYRTSVEPTVDEAIVESAAPNCVGACILALPVDMAAAIRLAAAPGAIVIADRELEQPLVPTVCFDDLDAGRRAAEHLVDLGHRRIAFAAPQPADSSARNRLKGARDFLAGMEMKLVREEIYPDVQHQSALDRILSGPDRPTALIASTTHAGEIMAEIAVARGLAVPGDLSVITFADPRTINNRTLSLVAMDHEALGRAAFEALLDEALLAEPRAVLLPSRLRPGATTAPPR